MFQATFDNCDLFKKLITCIDKLIKEAVFEFTETGIHLQAMDSSRVTMTAFSIPSSTCSSYKCKSPISVGINIPSLVKVLSCVNSNDKLNLSYSKDSLELKFTSSKFTLKTMNIDQEKFDIPEDLEYSLTECISSNEFAKICKDLLQFDESLYISKSDGKLTFAAVGDIGSATFDIPSILESDDISLEFSNQYLVQFSRASVLSDVVEIKMDARYPMMLKYTLDDVDLVFFLASKFI